MQEENAHTQACYGDNSGPKQKGNSFPDIGNEPLEVLISVTTRIPSQIFRYAISSFATSSSDMRILDSGDRLERIHETGATR